MMKVFSPQDFAALIGIDWADKKHDICEYSSTSQHYDLSVISSKPEAIHGWANDLKKRYPHQRIAVGCELKKGPLIYALSKYDHLTLFPINPASVAKYRKTFTHSGAKDDPTDAKIQTEILQKHMHKLRMLEPESPAVRALAQLVENRRKLVQDRVRLTNRITATLKNYYPQAVEWFKEKHTTLFIDFIQKWPDLDAVQRARENTLVAFFHAHHVRYNDIIEKRINAIKTAHPLTRDPGVIEPNQLLVKGLVRQLKTLMETIADHDQEIKQRHKDCTDHLIFDSFPGAGPVYAPRLLTAFGENRKRYESAGEILRYSGIAPVLERSGNKSWTHWRYSCPTFMRQSFVEWAGETVRYSFWAKAYYEQQKEKGKPHQTIIRCLAFKWIRIIYRCWKTKKTYDESTYLNALKKRHSPLLAYAISR
ncbi:IS110 family transposase [uncultured Cocleimonas sp.]|uniref:IS110 family transposase n=1 Tax=uncultured Cocleimonas sp. TaxID=1051587 RepID=UPI00262AEE81|nr:IS110 family transposase [uncultured Cocleimonas sp.]